MDPRISTVHVADYDPRLLRAAVRRHFEALDIGADVGPGTRVLLKPNLLMKREPDRATTTHPALVEAVAMELRTLGVRHITLADSPGGPYNARTLDGIYEVTGMRAAMAAAGGALNMDTGFTAVKTPGESPVCAAFHLLNPVVEADFVVNLPKLKTHGMMTLSAAVKNLFGCIPGLEKGQLHFRFPEHDAFAGMLCDLALAVRPSLTIVDAVVAMQGDGPSAGEPRRAGLTLAARDPFCLDLAVAALTGYPVEHLPTVRAAVRRGLCPADAAALRYLGDGRPRALEAFTPPASVAPDFSGSVGGPLHAVLKRYAAPRPKINAAKCIACGRCAESCPPRVIGMETGKARIRHKHCIRCYCCHELCPVRAITIKRPGLFKL